MHRWTGGLVEQSAGRGPHTSAAAMLSLTSSLCRYRDLGCVSEAAVVRRVPPGVRHRLTEQMTNCTLGNAKKPREKPSLSPEKLKTTRMRKTMAGFRRDYSVLRVF